MFTKTGDRVNTSPEHLNDEDIVTVENKLPNEITTADEYFSNSETLTPEVMDGLKAAIKFE